MPDNNRARWLAIRHVLVIRLIIAAALVLLVAGATTPLLTTERFYFFSNTFSLISGLRQLAANEQYLIAAVIALFSLCVPVVKAIVIWIAASEREHKGSLLAIADRFGKWSMLEVFIAALVIVALKLGPIVDATLHYGAYLLATSVLLSGLASQLLAHEPAQKPLFSSPVTLTLGAIGGAVAATLLIGMLNPGLLSFDGFVGSPETRCVARVLRLDQAYAEASANRSDYVNDLRSVDTSICPADFRDALADYIDAWEQLVTLDAAAETEPSWLDRAAARLGLTATRDERLEEIEEAWAELARVAGRHGITAPAK